MALMESMTVVGSEVIYTSELANVYKAYKRGTFSAQTEGHYYVQLCAGAQVTSRLDSIRSTEVALLKNLFTNFRTF